ncbi:MAG: patatin-like phospholipase family protein [Endozoicomonas sp.]
MFKTELFGSGLRPKPYGLGLTLSGGGAKCMAQIGLLQYLCEQGIEPNVISGVSGGAIVGALFASGHEPGKILEFFTSTRMFSLKNFSFTRLGLIDSDKISKQFIPWFSEDAFESLNIPLYVVATDLNRAAQTVFSSGPLVRALTASSAYPGMFTPVEWNGTVYADGGIINNYPSDLIHPLCRHHIGMYLSPVVVQPSDQFANTFDVLDRVFQIYSSAQLLSNIELPEVSLAPEGIDQFSAFMVKPDKLKTLFQLGYDTSMSYFENEEGEGPAWLEKIQGSPVQKLSWLRWPTGSGTS